jgi:transcriptional repressor NrdR
MRCAKCGCQEDKVIDSRSSREGSTIRRRRECIHCGHRFTTYEAIERARLIVVKRDGRREEFSREKLLAGITKACQKRSVSREAIEDLVERIVDELSSQFDREVPSPEIGARVIDGLRGLDAVAYVRYASVYRRFEEATEFVQEVKKLEKPHDTLTARLPGI